MLLEQTSLTPSSFPSSFFSLTPNTYALNTLSRSFLMLTLSNVVAAISNSLTSTASFLASTSTISRELFFKTEVWRSSDWLWSPTSRSGSFV